MTSDRLDERLRRVGASCAATRPRSLWHLSERGATIGTAAPEIARQVHTPPTVTGGLGDTAARRRQGPGA